MWSLQFPPKTGIAPASEDRLPGRDNPKQRKPFYMNIALAYAHTNIASPGDGKNYKKELSRNCKYFWFPKRYTNNTIRRVKGVIGKKESKKEQ